MRQLYFVIGLFCFLLQFVLAAVFYKERIAFSDTAFQLVHLIIEQKPAIMFVRMGAASYQYITLAAIWAHADLRTIMIVDSLSSLILFFVFYLFVFLFTKKGFSFLLIPLNLVILATATFYWPVTDTQLGLIWISIYAAFLYEDKWMDKKWAWPLHFLCILWVQTSHFLMVFPLFLLIFYYYGNLSKLFSRNFLIHLCLALIAFGIRYKIAQQNWYESGKLDIWQNLLSFPHLTSLASVHTFVHNILSIYAVYVVMLLFVIGWLLLSKRYLKATVVAAITIVLWLLVMLSYPNEQGIYLENLLIPLSFMVTLPLVVDIIPSFGRSGALIILLAILIRIAFIYDTHHVFTRRLSIYSSPFDFIEKKKLTGVYIKSDLIENKKDYFMLWASGYESMLLSSLPSPDSCMVVQIDDDLSRYSNVLNKDTSLMIVSGDFNQSMIPQRYFKLRKGGYKIINEKDQWK